MLLLNHLHYLFYDSLVILDQPLFQRLPLCRGNTRVESCQFPKSDQFIAHTGTCVLASLGVGVDIVLALPRLLESYFGVEPPHHYLSSLQALQGHNFQERDGVPVIPFVHLPYNGQQVPHTLRLPAYEFAGHKNANNS